MATQVKIFDTTLRDGEQSPGATMSIAEKVRIAQQLEKLNVDIIEAGFPASSKGDFEAVQTIARIIKRCEVAALCRTNPSDIDLAWKAVKGAKNPRIHTFISTSSVHLTHMIKKTKDDVSRLRLALWQEQAGIPLTSNSQHKMQREPMMNFFLR